MGTVRLWEGPGRRRCLRRLFDEVVRRNEVIPRSHDFRSRAGRLPALCHGKNVEGVEDGEIVPVRTVYQDKVHEFVARS